MMIWTNFYTKIFYSITVFLVSAKILCAGSHSFTQFPYIQTYLYSNPDSAEILIQDEIEKAIVSKNIKAKAEAYSIMVYLKSQKGKYLEALEYQNMASINLNELSNDTWFHAYFFYVRSLFNVRISNFGLAAQEAMKAQSIFLELSDSSSLAKVYTLLGGIYYLQSEFERCKEFIVKSLNLNQKLSDNMRLAGNYGNLASVFLESNEIDSALIYIEKAIEINLYNSNLTWLADNYQTLGRIIFQQKAEKKAFEIYNNAEELYLQIKDLKGLAGLQYEISSKYNSIGNLDSAKLYIMKSLKNAQLISDIEQLVDIYFLMSQIDRRKENLYNKSFEYIEKAFYLKDSLRSMEDKQLLIILEAQQEFERKQLELQVENERILFSSQKQDFYIILLSAISAFLGLSIAALFYFLKLRNRKAMFDKDELNKKLEHKSKELTLSMMSRVKTKESIQSMIKELYDVQKNLSITNKAKLSPVINKLEQSQDDDLWQEFEITFQNIHQNFYENLRKFYPDLSPAETKVCALLKLGLNTKEMAELLQKTPSSIEVDRARIRKKLGLKNQSVNLSKFIVEI